MNGPEIQKLIQEDLRRAVVQAGDLTEVTPLRCSPWVAASAMQKAIRRGRVELALAAGARLLNGDSLRLWRRLPCIAAEDVGLGSLEAIGVATAAAAGIRKRAELGGEWAVAHAVIRMLASAPKCRAADDLLMLCQLHPSLDHLWRQLAGKPARELVSIATGKGRIEMRALALFAALKVGPRKLTLFKVRRETDPVFGFLSEAGWPHSLVETARLNFNRTSTMLAPFAALLAGDKPSDAKIEPEPTPPEIDIDGVPSWAFDIYSREGRAAYTEFLGGASATAAWFQQNVPSTERLEVLGHAVFRVEGGVVDRRLRWPLSDQLRYDVDVKCMGVHWDVAADVLDRVRADIPAINSARREHAKRPV